MKKVCIKPGTVQSCWSCEGAPELRYRTAMGSRTFEGHGVAVGGRRAMERLLVILGVLGVPSGESREAVQKRFGRFSEGPFPSVKSSRHRLDEGRGMRCSLVPQVQGSEGRAGGRLSFSRRRGRGSGLDPLNRG
jgi:hypothetical protein